MAGSGTEIYMCVDLIRGISKLGFGNGHEKWASSHISLRKVCRWKRRTGAMGKGGFESMGLRIFSLNIFRQTHVLNVSQQIPQEQLSWIPMPCD